MKVVIAAQRKDPPKNQGFMRAPISLERPTEKEAKDGDFASFKLRSNPEDANSPLHEIKVQYWKGGTAEEWFLFQRDLERVLKGQNVTYAKDAYAITRGLLKGEFLTRFNVKAVELKEENEVNYKQSINAITSYILPKKALAVQKRYLRRLARKPPSMSMKAYVARYKEINDYLPLFPKYGNSPPCIAEDEMIENFEFAIPATWRQAMILQGFEPIDHSLDELIEFCERLEFSEDLVNTTHAGNGKNRGKSDDEKTSKRNRGGPKSGTVGEGATAEYDCLYHGKNKTHTTDQCKVLINQAKKMAAAHANAGPDAKRQKFGNKSWRRDTDAEAEKKKKKEELHAFITSSINQALEGASKKRKKSDMDDDNLDNFNYDIKEIEKLNKRAFDKLNLSDDED